MAPGIFRCVQASTTSSPDDVTLVHRSYRSAGLRWKSNTWKNKEDSVDKSPSDKFLFLSKSEKKNFSRNVELHFIKYILVVLNEVGMKNDL